MEEFHFVPAARGSAGGTQCEGAVCCHPCIPVREARSPHLCLPSHCPSPAWFPGTRSAPWDSLTLGYLLAFASSTTSIVSGGYYQLSCMGSPIVGRAQPRRALTTVMAHCARNGHWVIKSQGIKGRTLWGTVPTLVLCRPLSSQSPSDRASQRPPGRPYSALEAGWTVVHLG
jgi:hypothetical protein